MEVFFMASKGQKFERYDLTFKNQVLKEKIEDQKSYTELSKKYNIPKGTLTSWVMIYKRDGSLGVQLRGRPTEKNIDYKERYEILKKFQTFLEVVDRKKK